MTPAARVQAAIDLLDAVIAAARGQGASADRIAAEWFRARRYVGSKDRRAIRELVWSAIRACGPVPASGRAAMLRLAADDPALRALFDGSNYGPAPIAADEAVAEAGIAPQWLVERLSASGLDADDQASFLDRAPLDIRANTLKISREELRVRLPVEADPAVGSHALRLPSGTAAEAWPEFAEGLFEVQDAGSQMACMALHVQPGEAVVDLCAGAGGKTLALGAAMANRGTLLACDIDRARLSRLPERAARAGVLVETRLLNPGQELAMLDDWQGRADAVMIDAPCSGTGTWRRNPEARWRIDAKAIDRYCAMQANVLSIGAALVRPGGRLTYVVCSLLDAEGADRIDAFLAANPEWEPVLPSLPAGRAHRHGWRLVPFRDRTDGFFFATLVRRVN
ncbi:MAG: RNA methyltransferase [Novosphingobium sp. 28-62-57]|uniref:RsmB/NOP family class I SAM-dependent RNA methyltransferase n=1 Tax=unclassified Novosphingobium TaxID=2644732 RepID=UPI000BC491E6|nr:MULTISPECIES: RsmB/NOP family class I SAM-dependent RNA methyltransferase [unclassified Novosphingobium]OYW49803.1 MAG: RNA methyltransferase [Novosphingobium sp. 12-62-10]OYZ12241.1 MAG: RNA methyltransferase [Novosphingobium sp. 28-62-57]OZA35738.1 MAG: RNA methyltransferase [Novosphingobium sp. 17-62-9]HQS69602.1 RsmB/NOP family class I SAM-dependent RNA methyltransferase [Novosphingobium sp.]